MMSCVPEDNTKRGKMKKINCFLLVVGYFLVSLTVVDAKTSQEIFDSASPAVVVIRKTSVLGDTIGSGFIVDPGGIVITNLHAISMAENIEVKGIDGTQYPVVGIVDYDPRIDMAILKIDGNNLPALSLGDSNNLKEGDRVVTIGAPMGNEYTLSEGIFEVEEEFNFLRTYLRFKGQILDGNSGGPLLDGQGFVIGLMTASGGSDNSSFAVPIEEVQRLLSTAFVKTTQEMTENLKNFQDAAQQCSISFGYNNSGDLEMALKYGLNAESLLPWDVDLLNYIASIYGILKDYDQQISYARKALEVDGLSELSGELLLMGHLSKIILAAVRNQNDQEANRLYQEFLGEVQSISEKINPKMGELLELKMKVELEKSNFKL